MKSTSQKMWQTSLIFGTFPNIKLEEKNLEDTAYYIPPPEKVGGRVPRVPNQIAPMVLPKESLSGLFFLWVGLSR